MRIDTYKAFRDELDRVAPQLARAFEEAVADITSASQIRALEAAIANNDIQAVFRALALDQTFWQPLDRQIQQAFLSGALYQQAINQRRLPEVQIRFDGNHPRAENLVRDRAAALIVEITNDTRQAVRDVVRQGIQEGAGQRTIARRLIGEPKGNGRVGGIIGLTRQEVGYVEAARRELSDPATMRQFLRRKLRDARSDPKIARFAREGRRLDAEDIERLARLYADRLLRNRGDRIARTEALANLNAGRYEALQQAVDGGQIPAQAVTLLWQSTPDGRTRDTHRTMHSQERRFGQPFESPSGALLRYPGDISLGAPASETIFCRCGFRIIVDYELIARLRGTL